MKQESVFRLDKYDFFSQMFLFISSAKPLPKVSPFRLIGWPTIYHFAALGLSSGFSGFLLWTFENLLAEPEGGGLA